MRCSFKGRGKERQLTSRRGRGGKTSQGQGDLMLTEGMGSQATVLANQEPVPLAKPWTIWTLDFKVEGQAEEVTSYIMRCFPAILANSSATVSHSTIIPSGTRQPQGRIATIESKGHITITICMHLAISSLNKKSTPMEVIKKKRLHL